MDSFVEATFKKINDIRAIMSGIRKKGRKVYSNYFNQCAREEQPLKTWIMDKAVVFEWIDNGIKRIYFYSVDEEELTFVLSKVDIGSVIDFITKDKDEISAMFFKAGFRMYMEYGRFYIEESSPKLCEILKNDKKVVEDIFGQPYGEMAKVSDAEEIDFQLREEFDIYEAHFYSLEKLREHIKKGWVWVARENEKIIAAYLFEIQGCKAYGAYLYNRGGVEVMLSMINKASKFIMSQGVTYSYCWMRLDNKRIIRYNMKYNGYVSDGVYDLIYVKE